MHPTLTTRAVRAATLAALLAAPLAAPLAAQTPADTARALRTRMKSDLRNLVTAQEAHFATAGRYAPDLATLSNYRTSAGVSVEFVKPEANRWGASMRSAGFEGTCVIHVGLGYTEMPRTQLEKKAFPEGEPACDGDGELEATRWASAAASDVQRALIAVVKLQERFFGKTGAYATDLAQLTELRAVASVTLSLEVTPAASRIPGFLVSGVHARYPTANCIIRSGWGPWARNAATMKSQRRPANDIQVVCDDFAP